MQFQYEIGDEVQFRNNDAIIGVVIGIWIRENGFTSYSVSYWDGGTSKSNWFVASELKPNRDKDPDTKLGFGPDKQRPPEGAVCTCPLCCPAKYGMSEWAVESAIAEIVDAGKGTREVNIQWNCGHLTSVIVHK